jgi:hypothetical protein
MEPKSQEGKRDLDKGRPSQEIRIPYRRRIVLAMMFVASQATSPRIAIVELVSPVKRREMGGRENLLVLMVLVVGLHGITRVRNAIKIVTLGRKRQRPWKYVYQSGRELECR